MRGDFHVRAAAGLSETDIFELRVRWVAVSPNAQCSLARTSLQISGLMQFLSHGSFKRCHAPSFWQTIPFLGLGREADYCVKAPTGRRIPAQSNALGRTSQNTLRSEGTPHAGHDLSGLTHAAFLQNASIIWHPFPGLHPGLVCVAPLGQSVAVNCGG
jgi:hypothetical protein